MAVAGRKVTMELSAQTTAKLQDSLPVPELRADYGMTGDKPPDDTAAVSAPGRQIARDSPQYAV